MLEVMEHRGASIPCALSLVLTGCALLDSPEPGGQDGGSSESGGPFSGAWEPPPSCGDASSATETTATVEGQAGGMPLMLDCVPAGWSFHYFSATGVAPRPQVSLFCQTFGGGPGVIIAWQEDALVCGTTPCGDGVNVNVTPETDSIPLHTSCAEADEITDASVTLDAVDFGDGSELAIVGSYRAGYVADGTSIDVSGSFTFRQRCSVSCDPSEPPDLCHEVCPP